MKILPLSARSSVALFLVIAAVLLLSPYSRAADRVALVIGCSDYRATDKEGQKTFSASASAKDARQIAEFLGSPVAGFEVVGGSEPGAALIDPTRVTLQSALENFKKSAKNARVALIYFAGHGLEEEEMNYVLPVDVALDTVEDLKKEAVPVTAILEAFRAANSYANVLVLDVPKENPFRTSREWAAKNPFKRGGEILSELVEERTPEGTVVLFANGGGRPPESAVNPGAFTTRLLEQWSTPKQDILTAFYKVKTLVGEDSKGGQVPRVQSFGVEQIFRPIFLASGRTLSGRKLSAPDVEAPLAAAEVDPNKVQLAGSYKGSYTYVKGFSAGLVGQIVKFNLRISHEPGARKFTGVIDEDVSGFGVPKDDRLWADITGEVFEQHGLIKIQFVKTYRYFEQSTITYMASFEKPREAMKGNWLFPEMPNGGTFTLELAEP